MRDAIIQSLRAGVTPRIGHDHIQVGRVAEIEALIDDIERVADGGSGIRFVIGEYGSGKTFFLNLVRLIALEKKLVAAHADLNPDRRLHASGGQARSLYQELTRNIATRSMPEGGALQSVVERFVTSALSEARQRSIGADAVIHERLATLSEMLGGYDFAEVIAAYWRGHDTGDDALKTNAVRWLRGEFSTKTDARNALGVRTIVDDSNVYDHLKLMARFVRLAGYGGLFVCLDELVNLYKLSSGRARRANYEQLLRILNDTLQGSTAGLGFVLGGTPEFLLDTRKGLYSYEALQSRLAQNRFASGDLVDMSGPVMNLANLAPEDLLILLGRFVMCTQLAIRAHLSCPTTGCGHSCSIVRSALATCISERLGNTIKEFVNLLAVLDQNPGASWEQLVGNAEIGEESNSDLAPLGGVRRRRR